MDKDKLTVVDMARQLGIPESTARYYVKNFSEFIPGHGSGRKRRYDPQALEILSIIVGYFKSNMTATEVEERLSADFTREIDDRNTTTTITTTTQQPDYSLELIREDIESRRELTAAIKELTALLKAGQRPRRSWLQDVFRKGKH